MEDLTFIETQQTIQLDTRTDEQVAKVESLINNRRHSPFSFTVVCEMLGLDPSAVRKTLRLMKSQNVPARKAIPRARNNVRIPGRVYVRRAS